MPYTDDTYEESYMRTTKDENWKLSTQYGRDIHSGKFVEAICEHGIGHHKGVHGCDGCCENCSKEIWEQVTNEE